MVRDLALTIIAALILFAIGLTFAVYPAEARPVDPFTALLTGIGQAFTGQPEKVRNYSKVRTVYRKPVTKLARKARPITSADHFVDATNMVAVPAVPSYRPTKQHDVSPPEITVHPVVKPRDGQLLPGSADKFDPPMADLYVYPVRTLTGGSQRGIASWYGPGFHGRQTACGNLYNEWSMTAAHRTLKCGTVVEVHASNGKMVTVTIRDRGPYVAGRIIDLSRGAAEKLGMMRSGVAKVTLFALDNGG